MGDGDGDGGAVPKRCSVVSLNAPPLRHTPSSNAHSVTCVVCGSGGKARLVMVVMVVGG